MKLDCIVMYTFEHSLKMSFKERGCRESYFFI